ncbi:MAG: single-stranded DNA-binding protein [Gemmataceae bacterium]
MARLNKVFIIGGLYRDPEARTFSNGGKVVLLKFVSTGKRTKNQQTGEWEDEPIFLDAKIFSRGDYTRLVDAAEEKLRKGSQVLLEGSLVMESWESQGQKQYKTLLYVDNFQIIPTKGSEEGNSGSRESFSGSRSTSTSDDNFGDFASDGFADEPTTADDPNIPF